MATSSVRGSSGRECRHSRHGGATGGGADGWDGRERLDGHLRHAEREREARGERGHGHPRHGQGERGADRGNERGHVDLRHAERYGGASGQASAATVTCAVSRLILVLVVPLSVIIAADQILELACVPLYIWVPVALSILNPAAENPPVFWVLV